MIVWIAHAKVGHRQTNPHKTPHSQKEWGVLLSTTHHYRVSVQPTPVKLHPLLR